jgi:hypothetical protein
MNTCRSRHVLHSNVRRSTSRASIGSISLIEVSPPHAGHSPRTPMGADWGACMLCPFPLEPSASPWKVQVRLGLSLCRLTNRICAILTTSPILELKPMSPAHSAREGSGGQARRRQARFSEPARASAHSRPNLRLIAQDHVQEGQGPYGLKTFACANCGTGLGSRDDRRGRRNPNGHPPKATAHGPPQAGGLVVRLM